MEKTETMKHTKEPWIAEKTFQYRDSSISDRRGNTIAIAYKNKNIDGDDLANAKRIVACVNACEGITNEALEAGVIQSALINFEESLGLEKGEQFCFYDIPVLEDV